MAFEELERGDVVWGIDPLSETGRPMRVLGGPRFREHGVQRSTVLRSTKTYHEDALSRRDDDYAGRPTWGTSHFLPWSFATRNSAADVEHYLTSLVDERTDDVAYQSIDYIAS